MATTDKRKQSLYFPEKMLNDLKQEAHRLDRSLSWIVQRCVKTAMLEIRKMPGTTPPDTQQPETQSSDLS